MPRPIGVRPSACRHQRGSPVADARLTVATLNLRNIADRWPERIALLLADMAVLQPDLIGLQECVFAVQQDRILGAAGEGRYQSRRGWAGRPEYGNAVLGKEPLQLGEDERLDLGRNRSALRVPVTTPTGASLHFVVTKWSEAPVGVVTGTRSAERLRPRSSRSSSPSWSGSLPSTALPYSGRPAQPRRDW